MKLALQLSSVWFLQLIILVSLSISDVAGAADAGFPEPRYVGDPNTLGHGVQRTMNLLASSTPEHRNTVRVLFYGQSITAQDWWKQVADDLRQRFPHANLIIENRSIGGHSSQLLVKTAEADLYPFYPDLVIFHVYGSHIDYENIIRGIREQTTAEILIQNDHVNKVSDLTEEMDPAKIGYDQWDSFMNHKFLPATAAKFNTGFLDQRAAWKRYLADFQLAPSDLLRDGVHLNEHGCFVMAQLVNAYLRVNPKVDDGDSNAWVRTSTVGKDSTDSSDRFVFPFEGNRMDAIVSDNITADVSSEVWIDGQRPSEIPSLRVFSRVSAFPQSDWPCLLRVQSESPLLIEDWTLTLTEVSDDLKSVKFTLKGTDTGDDGEGTSMERFVSPSGRIVIEPEDWNLAYCRQVYQRTLQPGHTITWKVIPHYQDTFAPKKSKDPSLENSLTLAQGLGPGPHRLELRGPASLSVSAVRFYHPPEMARKELARNLREDPTLSAVLDKAKALLKTGLTAGGGYGEVWIRDLNTFIELALEVNDRQPLRDALLTFFKFQGTNGNIVDGYIPKAKANVGYNYRHSPLMPDLLAHKNTVETDQESSLVQAIARYVRVTGDRSILSENIDGISVLERLAKALDYVLTDRFDSAHGLVWGGTTADWGDVQPEHDWGVELDANSHRSIDIYDNALLIVAINEYATLLDDETQVARWIKVRDSLKTNVRNHLWDEQQAKFIPHLYLEGSPFPEDFDESAVYYHGGTAVAIEAGLLSHQEIKQSLTHMRANVRAAGASSIGLTLYPTYPAGSFKNQGMGPYHYQNGGDWCWFGGRMIRQLIEHGFVEDAYREVQPMLSRVLEHGDFYEWWSLDNQPRGSNQFRGSAGVLGIAIQELVEWSEQQDKEL